MDKRTLLIIAGIAVVVIAVVVIIVIVIVKKNKAKNLDNAQTFISNPYRTEHFFQTNNNSLFEKFIENYINGEMGNL